MFANLSKFKKYQIYISIQTLYSVLCWSTFWQRLQPPVFLGYDATSLAHLYLGSFSHFIFCRSSKALSGLDAQLFSGLIGFKSRLWLGHWRIFRDLSRSHSCVVFGCVLRVVVLLEGEPSPQSGPEHSGAGFLYLLYPSLPIIDPTDQKVVLFFFFYLLFN